jgi:hypothetical protein
LEGEPGLGKETLDEGWPVLVHAGAPYVINQTDPAIQSL